MNWDFRTNFNFPTAIRFGKGCIEELGPYLKERGLKRPLLVTDPIIAGLPFFKKIMGNLEAGGSSLFVYTGVHKNPIKQDVEEATKAFRDEKRDSIIGFGGGAPTDVARATCVLASHPGDLWTYEETVGGDKNIVNDPPHFVTVPTTSGTGSEVGRSAIISEDDTKKKRIIFHPKLMAKQVFADPELTMELPPFITAATGMDALTHNLEALVARTFHPMCEGIALEGLKLIAKGLVGAVKSPNLENRSQMLLGSMYGATAFQKGLGVVHSCAHPLSILFDTHHGLANAIMISYGVEFNMDVCRDRYKEVAAILGAKDLVQGLRDLNDQIGIPNSLKSQGIGEKDLEPLAQLGFADFCHPLNPQTVTLDDFRMLYRKAWN